MAKNLILPVFLGLNALMSFVFAGGEPDNQAHHQPLGALLLQVKEDRCTRHLVLDPSADNLNDAPNMELRFIQADRISTESKDVVSSGFGESLEDALLSFLATKPTSFEGNSTLIQKLGNALNIALDESLHVQVHADDGSIHPLKIAGELDLTLSGFSEADWKALVEGRPLQKKLPKAALSSLYDNFKKGFQKFLELWVFDANIQITFRTPAPLFLESPRVVGEESEKEIQHGYMRAENGTLKIVTGPLKVNYFIPIYMKKK